MSSVANWFTSSRRRKVEALIRRHAELVHDTVSDAVKLFEAWLKNDVEGMARYFRNVEGFERAADMVRRELVSTLIGGALEPEERSVLLRVVREADWIADWAHESCRIAMVVADSEAPRELKEDCYAMLRVSEAASRGVRDALFNVFGDPLLVVSRCDEVENLEERVDAMYEAARRRFLTYSSRLSPGVAVMLAFLLDAVENVADRCEDTSDRLREAAVAKR